MDHFDNSWFEKAIKEKKEKLENTPQGKIPIVYESRFKSGFNIILDQGFENLLFKVKNDEEI
jgi:hypothetical protein